VRNFARSFAVVFFVFAASCVGDATRIEVKIGPEPSLIAVIGWDVSSRLSFAFSFGVHLDSSGTQTGSTVLQTPSYTIGAGARYQIGNPEGVISPYVGVGGQIWLQGAQIEPFLEGLFGLRLRLNMSLYLLGEVCVWLPLPNASDWHLSVRLGAGLRF